ncbi:LOW QUALITY PROTEIN: hypothetical protein U9M48_007699 [Paspalum notatum var. saurae]|uniref:Uncharacterized protein n=1 Tax=Paspalum notatum var. saurae TaxID=547442 RepID=A0AAQ3SN73_PASNO
MSMVPVGASYKTAHQASEGPQPGSAHHDGPAGLPAGRPALRQLLHPPDLGRQPAHVLLRAASLAGQAPGELRHPPPPHEVLHQVAVVAGRVHAGAVRHGGEACEEGVAAAAAVRHELARHGDLPAHDVGQRAHHSVRVHAEELGAHLGVPRLVPPLVGGDHAADLGERAVAVLRREARRVGVRDEGGALLERAVDQAVEVVGGELDLAHVDAAGEVEVAVEEVAVAVLLGGPAADPARPGERAGAGGVADAVDAVAHALVRGQRLLRHHVAHQAHEDVVGQARRGGAELGHRLRERRLGPLGGARQSYGCHADSTGVSSGSMFSATHPFSDRRASTCSCGTGGHHSIIVSAAGAAVPVVAAAAAGHLPAATPDLLLARRACALGVSRHGAGGTQQEMIRTGI